MTKNDKAFVRFVKEQCKKHGIKCDLRDVTYMKLDAKTKVSGYFDESGKVLACSMNKDNSFGILVHEYAHMTQWLDKEPLFVKCNDSLIALWEWLDGKEIKNINKHIAVVRDMELNNEKRAVKLIKKHKLSLDIPLYIKRANSYIHFYNFLELSRKWCSPDNTPYDNEILVNAMSPKFNMKYTELTPRLEKLFIQENI